MDLISYPTSRFLGDMSFQKEPISKIVIAIKTSDTPLKIPIQTAVQIFLQKTILSS